VGMSAMISTLTRSGMPGVWGRAAAGAMGKRGAGAKGKIDPWGKMADAPQR
jgi:hypothetical protein